MKGNQHFKYQSKNKQLIHVLTSLCLDCDSSTGEVFMNPCSPNSESQKWEWGNLYENILTEWELKKEKKKKN
uniref:Ricin B lectin domain-containing protein n=3 Tax=Meloidogyne TaxID=189290 RepID=A0A6V7VXG3_MELEN|nr:unnamed protein product [Meloidogyne enterolobii]